MKKVLRRAAVLLSPLVATAGLTIPSAQAGDTVYIEGVGYEYRGAFALRGPTPLDSISAFVDTTLATTGACVPKPTDFSYHFADPSAGVYYGVLNSIYHWEELISVTDRKCGDNDVTISAQMFDQALDGSSSPAQGQPATSRGVGSAAAVAVLDQYYSNVAMTTGLSYHTLTTQATSTSTSTSPAGKKVTVTHCAQKSWTYIATAAGPYWAGSTSVTKCSAV